VRAKRSAPPTCDFAREARLVARGRESRAGNDKESSKTASKSRKFSGERALRAALRARLRGRSVADTPHIFCRLAHGPRAAYSYSLADRRSSSRQARGAECRCRALS
jgi:hypothetical protein